MNRIMAWVKHVAYKLGFDLIRLQKKRILFNMS